MSISDWKRRESIDESAQIRLVRLSHMQYQHPSFTAISEFLQDFGMHLVKQTETKMWWRGYGDQPYVYVVVKGPEMKYLGGAFEVETIADLEKSVEFSHEIKTSADCLQGLLECQAQV